MITDRQTDKQTNRLTELVLKSLSRLTISVPEGCGAHSVEEDILTVFGKTLLPSHSPPGTISVLYPLLNN